VVNKITSQCKYIKPDGSRCRAYCVENAPYCFWHDPESKSKRMEAQRKGGLNRRNIYDENSEIYRLSTYDDIIRLYEIAANNLIRGEMTAQELRSIVYLGKILHQMQTETNYGMIKSILGYMSEQN